MSPRKFPLRALLNGVCLAALLVVLHNPTPVCAAFGVVTGDNYHTVDTGAGLVFAVLKTNGSIDSIKLNGTELNIATDSGLISGLGSGGTTTSAWSDADTVVVTVQTDSTNGVVKNLTHYYIVRNGENTIYMATYLTQEPGVGELRWITRLQSGLFNTFIEQSDLRNTTGAIESQDVFGFADGTTRSKYYGNQRAKDLSIRGITGTGRGVFMAYGSRESSSGGPFFRDIQNQTAEVYNQMNSGHNQTEANRLGVLYGPYALVFTDGSAPSVPDMDFVAELGLTGFVGPAGRGSVTCAGITGRDTTYDYTVGFANATAQYWADADLITGAATCSDMKPGSYTMKVYKGELSVYSTSVTVTAGETTTLSPIALTADPSRVVPRWRIGNWDGTPLEFRNGANIPLMHPSDVRQASWTTGTFTVGASTAANFPSCQWMAINGSQVVSFNLTSGQIAAHTIRMSITAALSGARPNILVNSWTPTSLPSPSSQPDSRSITIGTYRGNNATYTFNVPSSAFVVGTNTLRISAISGSSGSAYLSPGYAIDCVDIYPTSSVTYLDVPAIPTGVTIQSTTTPNPRTITLSWNATTGAASYQIRRARSASGPYTVVASGLTALIWTDTDVAAPGVYYYLLSAVNGSGKGAPASAAMDPDGPPRAPAALKWTGSFSSTWNATGAVNWSWSGGSTYFFYPDDTVRFDDTSSVVNVTLSGTLTPALVTVDSTQNHTFSGSGTISGAGALIKSGSGMLTLTNNANNYSGGTTIAGGTLRLGSNVDFSTGGIGTGGIVFQSGTLSQTYPVDNTLVYANALSVASGRTGTILTPNRFRLNGAVTGAGTLNVAINTTISRADFQNSFSGFSGVLNLTGTGTVRLGINPLASGQPSFHSSGWAGTTLSVDGVSISPSTNSSGNTISIGALTSTGTTGTLGSGTAGTATYSVGGKNLDTTYAGRITGSKAALTKTGSGTLTLAGANTYTGATTVSGGALLVTGTLGATPASVSPGATIGGTGTLGGDLALSSGARLALGVGAAVTRGLTVSGTTTLTGSITVVPALLGGALAPGTYTLLTYSGSLGGSPTFTWIDTSFSGYHATFSTATPGQVKITLTAPAGPPSAPSGLAATAGEGQTGLTWNTASGATGYTVLRSTTSGLGYTAIASGLTTLSYTDSGLTNGVTYFYQVTAMNSFGASGYSNETSAKPVQNYLQWVADAFPGELDPAIIASDADPDMDGDTNLMEYFLGTSPGTVNAQSLVTCAPDGQGNIVLTFPMSKNLSNISCTVLRSTDLAEWTDADVTPAVVSDEGAFHLMDAVVPAGVGSNLFIRLEVTSE